MIYNEVQAEQFLSKRGFPVAKGIVVKNKAEVAKATQKIGWPVVIKIVSERFLHRTDIGGVKIVRSATELPKAFSELQKAAKKARTGAFLVQKFYQGNEVIIGLKKDRTFGHVLLFGLGGVFAELLKDVSFRICPATRADIKEMMQEVESYAILKGIRGQPPSNIAAIASILKKTSQLAAKFPSISELDINPLIVNRKKATIVDARIIFE